MKTEDWIGYLPVYFIRAAGHLSLFTVLYGLMRVIRIGEKIGVVTVCGVAVLAWKPAPE